VTACRTAGIVTPAGKVATRIPGEAAAPTPAADRKPSRTGTRTNRDRSASPGNRAGQKEAQGEIKTEPPGYLDAQDAFPARLLKEGGRSGQKTFIDPCSPVGPTGLRDRRALLPKCRRAGAARSITLLTSGQPMRTLDGTSTMRYSIRCRLPG
jgi:hypothetical protein